MQHISPNTMAHQRLAPAKLNLFLHITGRRDNGYHELESLMVFLNYGDLLTFTPKQEGDLTLTVDGPFAAHCPPLADNLVGKAADVVAQQTGQVPRGQLHLTKNLPAGAGVGGGSADAAAALHLWTPSQTIRTEELLTIGAELPVCYHTKPAIVRGIGEDISTAPALPPFYVVLAYPGQPSSTVEAYQYYRQHQLAFQKSLIIPKNLSAYPDFIGFLNTTSNALTEPALSNCPMIQSVLDAMQKTSADVVRMNGSGSSVFGIYASAQLAQAAAQTVRQRHPDWWVIHTQTIN